MSYKDPCDQQYWSGFVRGLLIGMLVVDIIYRTVRLLR
jgi:hypothetical protein